MNGSSAYGASKKYTDEHGGSGGSSVEDVKVDNVSIVNNKVANISTDLFLFTYTDGTTSQEKMITGE